MNLLAILGDRAERLLKAERRVVIDPNLGQAEVVRGLEKIGRQTSWTGCRERRNEDDRVCREEGRTGTFVSIMSLISLPCANAWEKIRLVLATRPPALGSGRFPSRRRNGSPCWATGIFVFTNRQRLAKRRRGIAIVTRLVLTTEETVPLVIWMGSSNDEQTP